MHCKIIKSSGEIGRATSLFYLNNVRCCTLSENQMTIYQIYTWQKQDRQIAIESVLEMMNNEWRYAWDWDEASEQLMTSIPISLNYQHIFHNGISIGYLYEWEVV